MGDISARGHFDLMTSQGLQVSRLCVKIQLQTVTNSGIVMADRAPMKRGGNYCEAGSRDNVSCTSFSPGISMHRFLRFLSDKVLLLFPDQCSLTR